MLARRILVLSMLDRDAHLLEGQHAALAQLAGQVTHVEVEVAPCIEWLQRSRRVEVLEVEVLELGGDEEGVAPLVGCCEHTVQRLARAPREGRPIEVDDVAEDPGHALALVQRQDLEGRRIGEGEDVGLLDATEAVHG